MHQEPYINLVVKYVAIVACCTLERIPLEFCNTVCVHLLGSKYCWTLWESLENMHALGSHVVLQCLFFNMEQSVLPVPFCFQSSNLVGFHLSPHYTFSHHIFKIIWILAMRTKIFSFPPLLLSGQKMRVSVDSGASRNSDPLPLILHFLRNKLWLDLFASLEWVLIFDFCKFLELIRTWIQWNVSFGSPSQIHQYVVKI